MTVKHAFGLRYVDQESLEMSRAKGRLEAGTSAEVRGQMRREGSSGVLMVRRGCAHIVGSIGRVQWSQDVRRGRAGRDASFVVVNG